MENRKYLFFDMDRQSHRSACTILGKLKGSQTELVVSAMETYFSSKGLTLEDASEMDKKSLQKIIKAESTPIQPQITELLLKLLQGSRTQEPTAPTQKPIKSDNLVYVSDNAAPKAPIQTEGLTDEEKKMLEDLTQF